MPFPKTPLSIDNKTKDNDMKKKQHLMTLAVLLLLASCSEQSDMQQTAIDTTAPVTLTASSGTAPLMRAADNLYNASTGFDGGEEAQVYMANSGGTQTGTAKFSIGAPEAVGALKQSTLTLADGESPIYYPSGPSGNVTLYGIYPAASISSHTVSYNQTSDANYKSSDLMYAKIPVSWSTLAEKYALKPNLPFQHQLVKLKVTIVKMEDVWHLEKVTMNNVKRSVTVAPTYTSAGLGSAASATGESGDGANEDAILISSGETASTVPETKVFTYACVYPAQTWNDGDENAVDFLTVNADGGVAKYKLLKTFQPGYEYTLTVYLNALAVGATVTIDNWGDATDCVVNPTTASGGTLKVAPVDDQTYTGDPITLTPAPVVTYRDKNTGTVTTLTEVTDYDLQYYNNTNAGQATILAVGKAGTTYEGQIGIGSFYIVQSDLSQASIANIPAVTYKRAAWEPELTVISNGKTLIKNVDYTVAFENNVNAGTATATITAVAEGNFRGTNSKTFTINKKSLSTNSSDFTITLSATSKVYNGSAQSVSVSSVKDSNSGSTATMTADTEYTVSGTTSASAAGTYTVTVTGQGNYTDSKTADWSITKRPVTLTAKAGEITKGDVSTYGTASSGKTFSSLTSSTYTTYVTASSGTNAGLASGHYVESIKLKPSTTSTVTTTGTLTPSAAVIKDASGNNVTSNYDITYATGTLTVKSATQRGTIITDPDNSNFIKVYTSETSGYKIPKSDTQTGVVWSNTASWGSKEQWQEIFNAVGGNDNSGYSVLNTAVSNASISGWTNMSSYYWTCTENGGIYAWFFWTNGWSYYPPDSTCNVRSVSAFTD